MASVINPLRQEAENAARKALETSHTPEAAKTWNRDRPMGEGRLADITCTARTRLLKSSVETLIENLKKEADSAHLNHLVGRVTKVMERSGCAPNVVAEVAVQLLKEKKVPSKRIDEFRQKLGVENQKCFPDELNAIAFRRGEKLSDSTSSNSWTIKQASRADLENESLALAEHGKMLLKRNPKTTLHRESMEALRRSDTEFHQYLADLVIREFLNVYSGSPPQGAAIIAGIESLIRETASRTENSDENIKLFRETLLEGIKRQLASERHNPNEGKTVEYSLIYPSSNLDAELCEWREIDCRAKSIFCYKLPILESHEQAISQSPSQRTILNALNILSKQTKSEKALHDLKEWVGTPFFWHKPLRDFSAKDPTYKSVRLIRKYFLFVCKREKDLSYRFLPSHRFFVGQKGSFYQRPPDTEVKRSDIETMLRYLNEAIVLYKQDLETEIAIEEAPFKFALLPEEVGSAHPISTEPVSTELVILEPSAPPFDPAYQASLDATHTTTSFSSP